METFDDRKNPKHPFARKTAIAAGIVASVIAGLYLGVIRDRPECAPIAVEMQKEYSSSASPESKEQLYPWHTDITATVFWVGEVADDSNDFIHNRSSVWVEDWVRAYGGVDDPDKRCGYAPEGFTPKENPFYFALPYNDLDDKDKPKPSIAAIPWDTSKSKEKYSVIKNRWIEIRYNGKVAYAQWEDAGPFGEDDAPYVFGNKPPSDPRAGLDLSPATAAYLGIDGSNKVDWRFIEEADVPDGPWKVIITRSGVAH